MEKKIIIVAVLIVGVIIYILTSWSNSNNDLSSKAIDLTKEYLSNENITIDKQRYIYISEILYMNDNVDSVLFDNCNMASGVLVTKVNNTLEYKPIIKCVKYNSVNNKDNLIKLNGDTIVVLNENDSFIDLGYEKSSVNILKDEENISSNIKVINYYGLSGSDIVETAERIILKTDDKTSNIDGSYDTSFPTIDLLGEPLEKLNYGEEYKEKGFVANDADDGVITDKVEVSGNVDSFHINNYELVYKITNSKGNYVSTKRKVQVTENNISSNGSCIAKVYLNEIDVSVDVPSNVKIVNYRYFVNNKELTSLDNNIKIQDNITKNNLPSVKVTINDDSGNSSLFCSIESKLTPQMYTDVNGYNCLEGYVCYKQKDYNSKYQATESGVGTIASSGCLPTSLAIISTKFDKRSSNGNLYTPETLISELIYTSGRGIWGYSNYTRVKYVVEKLNLKVTEQYSIRKNTDIFKQSLKEGKPVVALVTDGCYANRGGHYLTVIGINDDETKIFISDPYSKTTSSMHKTCTVNTWSDINEFINKGAVSYFSVIYD